MLSIMTIIKPEWMGKTLNKSGKKYGNFINLNKFKVIHDLYYSNYHTNYN